MRAWIQYKGLPQERDAKGKIIDGGISNDKHHYTRFGKEIPQIEVEIDVLKFLGCDAERGAYIASQLESDSRIVCKLGEETKKAVERMKLIDKERLNINKQKKSKFQPEIQVNTGNNIDIAKLKEELKAELKQEMQKADKVKEPIIVKETKEKIEA